MIEVTEIAPEGLTDLFDSLGAVYAEAFGQAPYFEPVGSSLRFVEHLRQHVGRRDFKCVIARQNGSVVGFAYGYRSAAGQWWHDVVAGALEPAGREKWLSDAFEVVDLAVHPEAQGHGVGRRLHDALLSGLPERTALLSTQSVETTALHLYRRSGWQMVLDDFRFPGSDRPWLILGRELSAPGPDPAP